MKKVFFSICLMLIAATGFGQTTVPGGNVSGTWTLAGSPYLIQGSIQVPNGQTLTIEPGVTVNFQGYYKLYMQGRILAIGTSTDSITFTAANTTTGWMGIRFDNTPVANDTSKFLYCELEYGKPATTGADASGGAFFFDHSSKAIISNCRMSNNSAIGDGGAIYCSSSNPIITHNTISNNISQWWGGGIYLSGSSGTMTISNNNISYNKANWGGGIACSGGSPTITHNIISYNQGVNYQGEGIWGNGIFSDGGNLTITFNTITHNTGAIADGGGIGLYNSGTFTVTNNFISYNTSNNGGGIFCAGTSIIINNVISNNSASTRGGGLYGGNPVIGNTITNNFSAKGGGVYCGSAMLTNNTICNNDATNGGGIYCELNSDPTLHNDILWGNSGSGAQVYLNDETSDPNFYYCDIQDSTTGFGLNGCFYTGTYQNNININPLFVTPSGGSGTGYDGTIANWSLQDTSLCINAGDPVTSGLNLPSTDIAGNPRITGSRIDIGAYESLIMFIEEDMNSFTINIYPNPATDYLTIEASQKGEIELLNIEGQIIKSIVANDNITTIDISVLPSGMYFVKAKTEKGVAVKKFVKE